MFTIQNRELFTFRKLISSKKNSMEPRGVHLQKFYSSIFTAYTRTKEVKLYNRL